MAFGNKEKTPLLYHSALVKMGTVTLTVTSDVRDIPSKGAWAVDVTIRGDKQSYWCENEQCAGAFGGRKGQTLTVQAHGSKAEASIEIVEVQNTPAPAAQAQRAPAPGKTAPHGATVGMAINCACANLTARGEFLDAEAVTQIASDLLRVAAWLEAGNLLPKHGSEVAQ